MGSIYMKIEGMVFMKSGSELWIKKSGNDNSFVQVERKGKDIILNYVQQGKEILKTCPDGTEPGSFYQSVVAELQFHGFVQFDNFMKKTESKEEDQDLYSGDENPLHSDYVHAVFENKRIVTLKLGKKGVGLEEVNYGELFIQNNFDALQHLCCCMNYSHDSLDELMQALTMHGTFPSLQTLYIKEASDANTPEYSPGNLSLELDWNSLFPKLETLVLDMVHFKAEKPLNLPELKRLNLVCPVPGLHEISRVLSPTLTRLEVVALDFCSSLIYYKKKWQNNDFKNLLDGNYKNLREIHLTSMNFDEEFIERLLAGVNREKLEVLNLTDNWMTAMMFERLVESAAGFPHLKTLMVPDLTEVYEEPDEDAEEPGLDMIPGEVYTSLDQSFTNTSVTKYEPGWWPARFQDLDKLAAE
jgi:hypothetical protein